MKEYKDYGYLTKAVALPDGKRKYIRAKTKRELEKKVLEFRISLAQDKTVVSNDMTVEQLVTLWLGKVKQPSVKPQSYQGYKNLMEYHLIPAIGDMRVCDVKQIHIIDVMNVHGYESKDSNKRFLSSVRALFRFAVENDVIAKSPVPERISLVGATSKEEKPLTPEQTTALLEYCRRHKDPNVYLFTLLALVTGMRRGELGALRWDCVDFATGEIHVRRQLISSTDEVTEELKTAAARRDIPVPPNVMAILRRVHAESTSTYVIAGRCNGHITEVDIAKYSRAWNRSGASPHNIHAHLFRKTYTTRLIESGTDPKRVQYLLGHTTLEMTLNVYALYDQESQRLATKQLVNNVFAGVANVAN